jgi:hypothetical protein
MPMHEDIDRPASHELREGTETEDCLCRCKNVQQHSGEQESPESTHQGVELAVWFDING